MKEKSFAEWILFFITINLLIVTLLMFFVPVYPWWFFGLLTLIAKFFGPQMLGGARSTSRKSKLKF